MASRPTQVRVGGIINPLQGAQQGLDAAGGLYNSYLDRETKKEQLAAEQKRWDITNDRAQQKFDAEMGEIQRTQQQRDLLNQYTPEAAKTIQANAMSQNKQLLGDASSGMIGGAKDVFEQAKAYATQQSPELAALDSEIKAAQQVRAVQGLSPEADAELRAKYDVFRNKVLDTNLPGVKGTPVSTREALLQGYKGYDVSREEAQQAMVSRLMEKGIDADTALKTAKTSTEGLYDSKKDIDARMAGMRKAALEANQQRFDNEAKLAGLNIKAGKSGSSGSSSKTGFVPYADIQKSVQAIVGEGDGFFSSAPGTMTDKQTADVLAKASAELASENYSASQIKQIIDGALVNAKDEGTTGVSIKEDNLKGALGIVASKFTPAGNSRFGGGSSVSLTLPGGVPAVGSFDDVRNEKAMTGIEAARAAFMGVSPAKSVKSNNRDSGESTTKKVKEDTRLPKTSEKPTSEDLDSLLEKAIEQQKAMEVNSPANLKQKALEKNVAKYNALGKPQSTAYYDAGPGPAREAIIEGYKKLEATPAGQEMKKAADVLNMDVLDYYMKYIAPIGGKLVNSLPEVRMPYSRTLLSPEVLRNLKQ